jgi:GT2 family glycosyltransferase
VVVVHYHRENDLSNLLESLLRGGWSAPSQIAVVNNGGDRALVGDVAMHGAVVWIDLPNPGYASAVNVGAAALTEFEYLIIATHELRFEERALEVLSDTLARDHSIGLCGPLLLDSRDGSVWSAGGSSRTLRGLPFHPGQGRSLRDHRTDLREVLWLDGACVAVRRMDFEALTGLNEKFFLYFEDVDFGYRVRATLGKRVVCNPAAIAYQSPGGNMSVFLATRNLTWLLKDHRKWLSLVLFVGESMARVTVGSLLRLGSDNSHQRARLRGLVEGLRGPR